MRTFLESSCAPMLWVISMLELALLVFMVFRVIKTKSKITLFTACITFGLFFDAFIIALGTVTSASNMVFLSRCRFLCHGLLIPLLFMICAEALHLKKKLYLVVTIITGVLMIAGLAEAIATKLDVVEIANVSRMASVKELTPGWAEKISRVLSFGTVIPLMIVGVIVWIKQKTPFLFLSGFLMFAFSALGPATGNSDLIFYISMYGELLMVTFLLLYSLRSEKKA